MDARALRDRFETSDGSSPEVTPLGAEVGRRLPLTAFLLLREGDVFEQVHGAPPKDGPAKAKAYVASHLELSLHGADPSLGAHVKAEAVRLLSGNPNLSERLRSARPISVDLIPPGQPLSRYGYPPQVSRNAAGLFWDHPDWPKARVALRQEKLGEIAVLVVHELAHAIQALAFTKEERDLLYARLLPTYRSRAAVDEVFAIYSERELSVGFEEKDLRAPGIYGRTRARWNEEHLLTRFTRNLYFPHKPLAGPRPGF